MFKAERLKHKRALLVNSPVNSDWLATCLGYVSDGLARSGIESAFINIERDHVTNPQLQSEFTHKFIALLQGASAKFDFVFTINRMPSNLITVAIDQRNVDLYSFSSVPVVTWLVDNIGHHLDLLGKNMREVDETILVADATSLDNGDAAGLPPSNCTFLPMWGMPRTKSYNDETRDIPILFSGSINAEKSVEEYRNEACGDEQDLRTIFDAVAEQMMDEPGTHDAFSIARSEARKFEREDAAGRIFGVIDRMMRNKSRRESIQAFKRLPITICGNVTDPATLNQSNIKMLGMRNQQETRLLAQKAQVFLGDFANFVGGVELRPSDAIANGSVFACNENKYFREHFPSESFLSTFPGDADAEERIAAALSDPAGLAERDRLAGEIYVQKRNTPFPFIN